MAKLVIKSKFDTEFRRISLPIADVDTYEHFRTLIENLHKLMEVPFMMFYMDPNNGDLLPINNDDNFKRAVLTAKHLLRLIILRKGECLEKLKSYGTYKPHNIISTILGGSPSKAKHLSISNPQDFRQVSAIIDVDVVPETCRRVRLFKHGLNRPLGFYIRDGTSVRFNPHGFEKVPGIFISRLVPGGLAESTGLLAINDEILEVNGIEVFGKTLDQVTDIMIANSDNLIFTIKPANQRAKMSGPGQESLSRISQLSSELQQSAQSAVSMVNTSEEEDQDEVVDLSARFRTRSTI